jgi:hypothetical protein
MISFGRTAMFPLITDPRFFGSPHGVTRALQDGLAFVRNVTPTTDNIRIGHRCLILSTRRNHAGSCRSQHELDALTPRAKARRPPHVDHASERREALRRYSQITGQ